MDKTYKTWYKSELGLIELTITDDAVVSLYFKGGQPGMAEHSSPFAGECLTQLDEYFKGERKRFNLKLAPKGTDFQKMVWNELVKIPYGGTVSYMDIARKLNNEGAIRAVGNANGRNPISIIVPCHRVIGSNGKLTGYAGGLWRKEWLLKHERTYSDVAKQIELFCA